MSKPFLSLFENPLYPAAAAGNDRPYSPKADGYPSPPPKDGPVPQGQYTPYDVYDEDDVFRVEVEPVDPAGSSDDPYGINVVDKATGERVLFGYIDDGGADINGVSLGHLKNVLPFAHKHLGR